MNAARREVLEALQRALAGDADHFVAAGDNARYQVWSSDQFVADPEEPIVYQIRAIPRRHFEQMREVAPERIHVIHSRENARSLRLLA